MSSSSSSSSNIQTRNKKKASVENSEQVQENIENQNEDRNQQRSDFPVTASSSSSSSHQNQNQNISDDVSSDDAHHEKKNQNNESESFENKNNNNNQHINEEIAHLQINRNQNINKNKNNSLNQIENYSDAEIISDTDENQIDKLNNKNNKNNNINNNNKINRPNQNNSVDVPSENENINIYNNSNNSNNNKNINKNNNNDENNSKSSTQELFDLVGSLFEMYPDVCFDDLTKRAKFMLENKERNQNNNSINKKNNLNEKQQEKEKENKNELQNEKQKPKANENRSRDNSRSRSHSHYRSRSHSLKSISRSNSNSPNYDSYSHSRSRYVVDKKYSKEKEIDLNNRTEKEKQKQEIYNMTNFLKSNNKLEKFVGLSNTDDIQQEKIDYAEEWLDQYNHQSDLFFLTDQQKCIVFRDFMKPDSAGSIFVSKKTIKNILSSGNWNLVQNMFLKTFVPKDKEEKIHKYINELKQKEKENVTELYHRLLGLNNSLENIDEPLSKSKIKNVYINALKRNIKSDVKIKSPDSLEKAWQCAVEIESAIKEKYNNNNNNNENQYNKNKYNNNNKNNLIHNQKNNEDEKNNHETKTYKDRNELKCSNCNKTGHLSGYCFENWTQQTKEYMLKRFNAKNRDEFIKIKNDEKNKNNNNNNNNYNNNKTKMSAINSTQENKVTSIKTGIYAGVNIHTNENDIYKCRNMQIDTGSPYSFVSVETFHKMNIEFEKLTKSEIDSVFSPLNPKQKCDVLGKLTIEIQFLEKKYKISVHVVQCLTSPFILGLDFLHSEKCILSCIEMIINKEESIALHNQEIKTGEVKFACFKVILKKDIDIENSSNIDIVTEIGTIIKRNSFAKEQENQN
jgi:hypothetical protein